MTSPDNRAAVSCTINGRRMTLEREPDTPLLWVLRDSLGLTGTKFGCGIAVCGTCTVLVDGAPVRACVTPLSAIADRTVTTIEGVSGTVAEAVQAAWTTLDVPQCGYCQSGQVIAAIALLSRITAPTDDDIDLAMQGMVCRCGTYPRIRAAIHRAANALHPR